MQTSLLLLLGMKNTCLLVCTSIGSHYRVLHISKRLKPGLKGFNLLIDKQQGCCLCLVVVEVTWRKELNTTGWIWKHSCTGT